MLSCFDTGIHRQQRKARGQADCQEIEYHHLEELGTGHDGKPEDRNDGYEVAESSVLISDIYGLGTIALVRCISD